MIAAQEQLNVGHTAVKHPIDPPRTYADLLQVITILGNGAYSARRMQLISEKSETFEEMKGFERQLLNAIGLKAPAAKLTTEDSQVVTKLFEIMEVPSSPSGRTSALGAAVTAARRLMGGLFHRAAL
ncbi:TPA: hypothetical protein DCL30_00170 [Candidatus Peribacteria bacterium]|nr:MAG: hypothetical protein A3J91_05260 [Candidatus Peribacteria bacterium RIFOXYC2_FULL_58_10]OGJ84386.1 MAG: hypothetical protein A2529_03245 [Candidatus Peribacteria bacterium RIFOXYD2_FULL_58_15]HAI97947.1 hypothetical protein [Candidatus Peribacteria bacterium]HAS34687.1 hypothetical protein [Candidatus Peribacteria bacterium]